MLARGEISRPGVHAPEAVIDPDRFIAELARRGIRVELREEERRLL
jgi:hypothetical protein